MIPAGPSICDVLPSVAAVLGSPDSDDRLGLLARCGRRRQVVLLVIDGLGLRLLDRLAPHAPFLAAALGQSAALEQSGAPSTEAGTVELLRSTFPSTTPTSLVSLGTGVRPGQHGVLGFTVNVPGTSRVLTHVRWRDDPPPARWQPIPTWYERLHAVGIESAVVLPAAFERSGLTSAAYRGARFVASGAGTATDPATITALLDGGAGVRLVQGYTDVLDAAAHRFGIDSPQWLAAARAADEFVATIAAALPRDAVLLVTADHGGLDVPPRSRLDLDTVPALSEGIVVIAGEPRVRYLHTRSGASGDVVDTWRGALGTRATVVTRDEAIDTGWFGPMRGAHAARIGDVVIVCRADTAVFASSHEPPEVAELIGFHGSDTDVETAVPLIVHTSPA